MLIKYQVKLFAIFGFLVLIRAFIPIVESFAGVQKVFGESSNIYTLALLLVTLFSTFFIMQTKEWPRFVIYFVGSNKIFFIVLLSFFLSTIWSVQPDVTFKKSIALLSATIFSVFMLLYFKTKDFFSLLLVSITIAAISSLFWFLLFPFSSFHAGIGKGGIQGVFEYKNVLGRSMIVGVLSAFCVWALGGRAGILFLSVLFIFLLLIFLSASATAIALIFVIILLVFSFYMFKNSPVNNKIHVVGAFAFLSVICLAAIFLIDVFVQALGRDLTFTGRTAIYLDLLPFVFDKLMFGYGFGAFWLNDYTYSLFNMSRFYGGFPPSHAHSGIFEILLDSGLFGLFLYFYLFFSMFQRAFLCYIKSWSYYWLFIPLIAIFIIDFRGSVLITHGVYWVVFIFLHTKMYFELYDRSFLFPDHE